MLSRRRASTLVFVPVPPATSCRLALVGETSPVERGLRLVYEPTFHDALVVVVARAPGFVELHRIPAALDRATFFRGPRFVVPDAHDLSPSPHPSDLAEVDAARLEAILLVSSRLPARDDPPRDDYRDGMRVVIERGAEVFGHGYPVGEGPVGHTELARLVLEVVVDVLPREREHVDPLLAYLPSLSSTRFRPRSFAR